MLNFLLRDDVKLYISNKDNVLLSEFHLTYEQYNSLKKIHELFEKI